ncbi:hypothetical protein TSH7_25315 [Azospirillum sp. TSH7]|uniref:DUF3768 domain-containing protein n=1 Tax=unclassified Azospirillum TaxID=2630922 RepID=UPI000D6222C7|nr:MULTISPECIES: DUF3768 domain-containing protein [unclassified Azospirillum]PWC57675.1 hypothetical protein TSH7_25315 [Azospirillum sp. TSH7]PWC64445.1 hypothetical protein TSH20_18395 [Azospirillum sp. TSH20]
MHVNRCASRSCGPILLPYDEQDCMTIVVRYTQIMWKIDYYDPTMTYLSSNPADPSLTVRMLTIMLASEY